MKTYFFVAGFSILLTAAVSMLYTNIQTQYVLNTIKAVPTKQPVIVQQIPTPATTNSKALKVFDGNSIEIGIYIPSIETDVQKIFIPSVNRFLDIKTSTGTTEQSFDLLFVSNNCSGMAYYATTVPAGTTAPAALNAANSHWQIIAKNNNKYYSVDTNTKVITTHLHSSQKQNEKCKSEDLGNQNVIPVMEVTLPFSLPLTMPLEVRYE